MFVFVVLSVRSIQRKAHENNTRRQRSAPAIAMCMFNWWAMAAEEAEACDAAQQRCADSTLSTPMAATGLVNLKATSKVNAGAELTKEYLALELAQTGHLLAEGGRYTSGDIKLKKGDLIERLAGIKGGYFFERMVDPEGGIGGPTWLGGVGATRKVSVSSAAQLTSAGGGGHVQVATGEELVGDGGVGGGQSEVGGALVGAGAVKKKKKGKGQDTKKLPTRTVAPKPKGKGKRGVAADEAGEQEAARKKNGGEERSARSGRSVTSTARPERYDGGVEMEDAEDDDDENDDDDDDGW